MQQRTLDHGGIGAAVHEHMRNKLPGLEKMRFPVMQTEIVRKIYIKVPQYQLGDHHQHIDDDDILDDRRKYLESRGPEFSHGRCFKAGPVSRGQAVF